MKTKFIGAILLFLVAMVGTALAVDFNDRLFRVDVEVDNVPVDQNSVLNVEAGSVVPIEVFINSLVDPQCADAVFRAANQDVCEQPSSYRTRVEAFVGGYEYGKIQAVSPIFEVEHGVSYRKVLNLEIPEDLRASDDYTLNVEVFDDDDSRRFTYTLRVQEPRHKLSIQNVLFSPGTRVVKQGQPLFVSVRVENMGDNREKDVHVVGLVPQLGLREEDVVDELITMVQDEDDDRFRFDKQTSENTRDLQFFVPEDAEPGEYDLVVRAVYNRGHSVAEKTFKFRVEAVEAEEAVVLTVPGTPEPTQKLIVNVDSMAKSVNVGGNVVYTFNVANLGQSAKVFTVEVLGADFANVRVDPQVVTVAKDSTGETFVAVSPKEGTGAGAKNFVVRLLENGKAVSEVTLTANVLAEEVPAETGDGTVKKVLEIGFIVLLVILVILAIAVIIKKLVEGNDDEGVEGQTYY